MRYAKLKSNGKIVSSQTGDAATDDADALTVFAAGVAAGASNIDVGYETDAVVEGWWAARRLAELTYSDKRKAKYNALNQDEMRYDDVKNSTTTWIDAIDAIKAEFPKP